MSQASDFPITFGYKATDAPYGTPEHPYHRGVDRYMPEGTPVLVNGVQIGLSGMTGWATGAHLHIGRFVSGADTNPGQGGFTFSDAVVAEINEDPENGKYVRVQADGASWVYLHLSKQTAVVGQVLKAPKGEEMTTLNATSLRILEFCLNGWDADEALSGSVDQKFLDAEGWKDPNDVIYSMFISNGPWMKKIMALQKGVSDSDAEKILAQVRDLVNQEQAK